MYKLEKEFFTYKDSVQVHHVCEKCFSHIGVVSADFVSCSVAQCGWKMSVGDSLTGGQFFFYLPLRLLLIDLLENHDILHSIRRSKSFTGSNNLCDIVDGNMCRKFYMSQTHSLLLFTI